jgi:hypothetical protein
MLVVRRVDPNVWFWAYHFCLSNDPGVNVCVELFPSAPLIFQHCEHCFWASLLRLFHASVPLYYRQMSGWLHVSHLHLEFYWHCFVNRYSQCVYYDLNHLWNSDVNTLTFCYLVSWQTYLLRHATCLLVRCFQFAIYLDSKSYFITLHSVHQILSCSI